MQIFAGTEYNHSVIAQPLRYMLDHYLSKANNGINIRFMGITNQVKINLYYLLI